jgi:glycogen synthase
MRVQVVTPWYPDRYSAYSGIFVKKQVDALASSGHQVGVEMPVIYPAPPGEVPEAVHEAMGSLAGIDPSAVFATHNGAVKVPAPVPSRSGDLGRAAAFERSLALKRSLMPVEADVTHAHLGIPTGLALLRLGVEPLVVTEHQSTLDRVFGQSGGPEAYEEVVERSAAFMCVSQHLKDQIAETIDPAVAESIEIVPNIVDLADIPFSKREKGPLKDWMYVGTIASHKGVELLLKSFKAYREIERSATLTIAGDGPHRPWVERFAAGSGLSGSLRLLGSVPHRDIGSHLAGADVFIHLSHSETFGIATLEAIGAGLPVVSLRNGGAESAWGDIEQAVGRLLPGEANATDVVDAVLSLEDDDSALDPALGRTLVEERFSASQIAEELADIYEKVR